jgi:hypothetical protein
MRVDLAIIASEVKKGKKGPTLSQSPTFEKILFERFPTDSF